MNKNNFDVVVIGSGPGGYVCAIRLAQLGFNTAIIEKYNSLGGTCLNVGCIPSKSLLDSSHHYEDIIKNAMSHGIEINGKINLNFNKMIERKNSVVNQTVKGIDFLMNKNKISVFNGKASFIDKNNIKIEGCNDVINFKKCVIATGSKPISLPFIKVDKERIITSTEALSLKEIPKNLTIIGGGVIGLELGQVYKRLGSEVTVIEYSEKITPFMDDDISKELLKVLKKQKINFLLSHEVFEVKRNNKKINIKAKNKEGKIINIESDYCLVSVGRKAYTEGLGLENLNINTDKNGKILIDKHFKTATDNIYAIGDVVSGPMLAHKAEEEGIAVAEIIAGQYGHVNYDIIPGVIYTSPEVASIGKTEEDLKKNGTKYKIGKFSFMANSRAKAINDTEGFVKLIADEKTDKVLGVHIIGSHAGEMIAEIAIAMEFSASAEDIARTCHAHPTFSEAIKEAALSVDKRQIHS